MDTLENDKLSTSFNGYTIRMYIGSPENTAGYVHHVWQDGEVAVLVRDEKRILKVEFYHALPFTKTPQLIALPWDSSHFELRVNQTVYNKGPVLLLSGDKLQLCLRYGWSDDLIFEITAASSSGRCGSSDGLEVASKPENPRNTSLHGDPISMEAQKADCNESVAPLSALWCRCQGTSIPFSAQEFVKWSNYYAYRYNNLYRNMNDACPLIHQADIIEALSASTHDCFPCDSHSNRSIGLKNHYSDAPYTKGNLNTFTMTGCEVAERTNLLSTGTLFEPRQLLERGHHICLPLGDVSTEHGCSSLKPVTSVPSPWQNYFMSRIV
ncbi:unnamed protein product [Phytomonas sp. Hart1]|nr:unnamed protein product [Phytomonas sp. Hart1]|eukprot:CCW66535.1 unnamed protein product [Phytomonas sp. isolate Hart1]